MILLTVLCIFSQIDSHNLRAEEVHDPYRGGEKLTRLTINGRILLPASEVNPCIEYFRTKTLNDGSEKLSERLRKHYFGISKGKICAVLKQSESYTSAKPMFCNKAPLKPVAAKQPMERHQLDLVDLSAIADLAVPNPTDHMYCLSILDVFSRYLWARIIYDKRSETVAEQLENLYYEVGTPQIIQTDRGTEFRGAVSRLCKTLEIKLVYSSPHHPQSQGKVERSHSTWKAKIRSMIHDSSKQYGQDWSKKLPYIVKIYNDGFHRVVKNTPYELLFGVPSNLKLRSLKGGLLTEVDANDDVTDVDLSHDDVTDVDLAHDDVTDIDFPHDDVNGVDFSEGKASAIKRRKTHLTGVRKKATQQNEQFAKKMVTTHAAKFPPNKYKVGEIILVKIVGRDKGVKRTGLPLNKPKAHSGIVCGRRDEYKYDICLLEPIERWGDIVQVGVDKITSLTVEQEVQRRRSENVFVAGKLKRYMDIMVTMFTTPDKNRGHDSLLRNAAIHGMRLDQDNSGNGNCMYIAISQQLEKLGIKKSHKEVRREIVDFLFRHPVIGTSRDAIHLPSFVDNCDLETYLTNMAKDGTWGDHIVLLGAANLYNMGIWIVSSLSNSEPIIIEPADGLVGDYLGHIHLGHIADLHYVTLVPVAPNNADPSVSFVNSSESQALPNVTRGLSEEHGLCDACGLLQPHDCSFVPDVMPTDLSSDHQLCDACGTMEPHECLEESLLVSVGHPHADHIELWPGFDWCACKEVQSDIPRNGFCELCGRYKVTHIHALSDTLLIAIFALASMYSDHVTNTISSVCKRWHSLIGTHDFRCAQTKQWRKTSFNWNRFSAEFRQEYEHVTPLAKTWCRNCNCEMETHAGPQRGPDGLMIFYSDASEFCSAYCEYSFKENDPID